MFYLIGVIPVIFGISLATVSTYGTGISIVLTLMPIAASTQLHKRYPEACKKAFFILKPRAMNIMAVVAFAMAILQIFLLFRNLHISIIVGAMLYICAAFGLSVFLEKRVGKQVYSGDADKDF